MSLPRRNGTASRRSKSPGVDSSSYSSERDSSAARRPKATEEGRVATARRAGVAGFRFPLWLRLHGVDIITLIVVAALIIVVRTSGPSQAATYVFPIFNTDGSLLYPEYAYPKQTQAIPTWACALMAILIPIVFFGLAQIRRRSMNDFLATSMGVLKSVVTASLVQVVIAALITGPRPHFYSACQPDLDQARSALTSPLPDSSLYPSPVDGGRPTLIPMFTRAICSGIPEEIDDAMKRTPSGPTTLAWSGLSFLSLYFNAQLKVVPSSANVAYWKLLSALAPLLVAAVLSFYTTPGHHYHISDLLIGAVIGIHTSLVVFRHTFASVWDFRFNHILLPKSTSLFYRRPDKDAIPRPWFDYSIQRGAGGRMRREWGSEVPFTREGGWGLKDDKDAEWVWEENATGGIGAPGDGWTGPWSSP